MIAEWCFRISEHFEAIRAEALTCMELLPVSGEVRHKTFQRAIADAVWLHGPESSADNEWLNLPLRLNDSSFNVTAAPATHAALAACGADVRVAGFSLLRAGATIPRHRDFNEDENRPFHLALVCAPDGCALHLLDEGVDLQHREREWLTFDDTKFHSASNQSPRDRCVLYLVVRTERPAS